MFFLLPLLLLQYQPPNTASADSFFQTGSDAVRSGCIVSSVRRNTVIVIYPLVMGTADIQIRH